MKNHAGLLKEEIEVQDRVSGYYDNTRYACEHSLKYHKWLIEKMMSLVKKDGLILDNGCGTGILASLFPHRKIIGLDISVGMLDKARLKNKYIVCANSESLPFKSRSFDTIFSRSILHHLVGPRQAITEMHRVLKLEGELVLMETNKSVINDLPRKLMKKTEHFSNLHKNFDKKELLGIINERFIVTEVYYFGFLAYPLIGFPDLLDIFKYFPYKRIFSGILIAFDKCISRVPLLRTQSWGLIIKSVKRGG